MSKIHKLLYLILSILHLTAVIICFFILDLLSARVELWTAVFVTFFAAHLGFWLLSLGMTKVIEYYRKTNDWRANYTRVMILAFAILSIVFTFFCLYLTIEENNFDFAVATVFTMPFWSLAVFICFYNTKLK